MPTQLHRLLDTDAPALRSFHTVLLGGGPIDPALRERAAAEDVHVVATYGAAETAGGCVYDGYALDGVALALDRDGRIRIAGPTLFDGYEGDPEQTAEVLVDGWFLHLRRRPARRGRSAAGARPGRRRRGEWRRQRARSGRGGPAARAPGRSTAAEVLGVPDEEWGNRVVAFVVGALDVDDARAWVGEAHPRSWAPRQLVVLDAIPLLPNGKPDRLALKELA